MAYLMCVYYKRELIFTEIEVSKLRDPHIIDDIFFKIEREKAQRVVTFVGACENWNPKEAM